MKLTSKIMCVGLCCVDDIFEVHKYPKEDSDQRTAAYYQQRGGNAATNCSVLGILGANVSYLGTIANTSNKEFILDDFRSCHVNVSSAIFVNDCDCPKSFIIISKENGSRTIIHHNNDLPEVTCEQFLASGFESHSWIHFEGRNVSEVCQMMSEIRKYNSKSDEKITISIEIEKADVNQEKLIPLADFVFVSKDFALMKKCESMEDAVTYVSSLMQPHCVVICPWGEKGATAMKDGHMYFSPIFPPENTISTLGAGDTFIASTIFALMSGQSLDAGVEFGCRVAGLRVGFQRWKDFKSVAETSDFIRRMKISFDQQNNN